MTLPGLREVRDNCGADVAAGEYGYSLDYFARMVGADAIDCLQADVTRCGGYTVWLQAASVAAAHNLQISGHCAPNLHAHVATAVPNLRHRGVLPRPPPHRDDTLRWDPPPDGGQLVPATDRHGHGLTLRAADATKFRVG